MTHKESDNLSFQTSKLEKLVNGFVRKVDLNDLKWEKMIKESMRTIDLVNLEERLEIRMEDMENNMVERIVKLIQNP